MGLPIEFYIYVGYGLFSMLVVIGIMAFLLGGFLRPFMEVKRSRGAKILVRVRTTVSDYFRAGHIEEGFLVYKDRQKNTRRIPMIPGVVSRAATVFWVEADEEKNCLFKRDSGEAVSTYDPVKVDNLLVRALMRAAAMDAMMKIILLLLILVLVGVIAVGFLTYKNGVAIGALQAAIQAAAAGVGVVP